MSELIDTHCHLDSFARRGELQDVLQRAADAGVTRMIAIGTSSEDWSLYARLAEEHPGKIYWTVGLHPNHVEEDWREQVMEISTWFGHDPLPVALGEIGLDYFRLPSDPSEKEEVIQRQQQAFAAQLELALQFDCPVVIHSRNSFDDCLRMIDKSGVDWSRVVFHCFTNGAEEVRVLNGRGGRASFTGIVTYKNGVDVRQAAVEQGLERLMVETDAPYLSPEPHRGKQNEPANIVHTAASLANALNVPEITLRTQTTANAVRFFNLQ